MKTVRIIPCLDVSGGRVVKGVQFQDLRDAGDPVELADAYRRQGADELVLLDVSATPEEREHGLETLAEVREVLSIPMTVGGGIRSVDDARRLLEVGADKVAMNTAAYDRPELLGEVAESFGRQCCVAAVDAARTDDGWEVVVRSGTEFTGTQVTEWVEQVEAAGAGEILLTSFDRDGTRAGYDLELLEAVTDRVSIPIIASGGADGPVHFLEAVDAGADAVLAASIFHEGEYAIETVKSYLADHDIPVRLEVEP